MNPVELCDINHCTGCGACSFVCCRAAIKMIPNSEGFLTPVIDEGKCIGCTSCQKVCPVLNPNQNEDSPRNVYAAFNLDEKQLKNSASGGAFPAFANYFYDCGGVVVSAAFDSELNLKHVLSFSREELHRFQGSKYVQSDVSETYPDIVKQLELGKEVLFVGTPCQVAGVKSVVKKHSERLFTIDLVCHGVPSPSLFKSYLSQLGEKLTTRYDDFWFRSKKNSFYFIHSFKTVEGRLRRIKLNEHSYICAYLKGWIHRESCYRCPFAKIPRQGDCTISDFWGIIAHKVPFTRDHSNGISMILLNTSKGQDLFEKVKHQLYYEEKSLDEAKVDNHNLYIHDKRPAIRDIIYSEICTLPPSKFMKKYNLELPHPPTIFERISSRIRSWLSVKKYVCKNERE